MYYALYNCRDIEGVVHLIADDCTYEDLIYQDPFKGKDAIRAYFEKIDSIIPEDVKFCVEDISDGSDRCVGVRWHVELDGVGEFPFSRGVSFYEINEKGQIVFARDIVEPTFKPGAAALKGIALIAPLVRRLGPAATPANLSRLPIAAGAMLIFWVSYLGYVLVSDGPPGLPAWQTSPEAILAITHESANFFYINIALAHFGLNVVPSIAEHPVDEALFNFVNAWSLMMWPAMVADPAGKKVGRGRLPIWCGTMFLTNVFFPLYMALRLVPKDASAPVLENPRASSRSSAAENSSEEGSRLPWYAPTLGGVAVSVGVVSLVWALGGRPEYGDLADRVAYFKTQATTDRIFWAFLLDSGLYAIWQATLLGASVGSRPARWHRWVPFFGMAAWLIKSGDQHREHKE